MRSCAIVNQLVPSFFAQVKKGGEEGGGGWRSDRASQRLMENMSVADHFVQGAFAFTCSIDEAALIEEAWQLAADLMGKYAFDPVSAQLLAAFPPAVGRDQMSGFTAIFDDINYPDFGADLTVKNSIEDPGICTVSISGTTDFQPWPIAGLIQRCCRMSLEKAPVGFDWSFTCNRARPDSFGGGWCAVFPDRIEMESTREALSIALKEGIL